ncbi:MAG: CHAT domain-containing protein [Bacteroidetes bacterium]|nr:MAG: CHAT domain-containing protein [Bacteroidota bacterium]
MRIINIIFVSILLIFSFLAASSQTWQALYDSANTYINIEDYQSALPIAEKALTQTEKVFGNLDSNYSKTIAMLAELNLKLDEYDIALQYAIMDTSLKRKIYTENSLEYANSIFEIAAIQLKKNNYLDVEKMIRRGIDIVINFTITWKLDKTIDIGSCQYITRLLPMLSYYAENVDEEFFDEFVLKLTAKIFVEKYGNDNLCYGWVIRWLGKYYEYNKRYKEAIETYNLSLNLALKYEPISQPYTPLNFLSEIYIILGSIRDALKYNEKASKIKNINDIIYLETANTTRRFGVIYTGLGEYEKADSFFLLAGKQLEYVYSVRDHCQEWYFFERKYFAYYQFVMSSYNNEYANLFFKRGKYYNAIELFKKAIEWIELSNGRNSYFYYRYNFNLAKTFVALNRFDEADSLLLKVIKNDLMRIQYAFSNLSSSERIAFLKDLKKDYDYLCWYVLSIRYKTNPELIQELYDYNLTFKGLLLYKSKKLHDFICNTDDEELKRKYIELERKTNLLSKIYHASQNPNTRINTDTLEQSINNSERELSLSCPLMYQYNRSKNITWKDIQFTLKDNEAAIEIIRFRHFGKVSNKYKSDVMEPGFTDTISYAALIIKKGLNSPEYVLIENGNELESASYKKYMFAMNPKDSLIHNHIEIKKYLNNLPIVLKELRNGFWGKIQEKLSGISKVYLSADGIYNKINLNSLFSYNNNEHSPDIYLLSSTKDLAEEITHNLSYNKKAILFGNPNYNYRMDNKNLLEINTENKDDKSGVSLKRTKDGNFWTELPATKNEVKSIKKQFNLNGWQASAFIENSCSESAIKEIVSPNVLHIATHGYFDEDLNAKEDDYSILNNPLLRSGLVFAGANDVIKLLQNNSDTNFLQYNDDGLLTAYEIMNMNLSNTDLVVLSACETGLGEVMNGEGVFGLQRAFQVAGAKNIVMSLWEVDDEATQKLMTLFYDNWLKTGNAQSSLKAAQKEMKKNPKYSHPRFWGGFVVLGRD